MVRTELGKVIVKY